jgi:hypothetical protein
MPALITFNQTGQTAGVAGNARKDIVTGTAVTCTNATVETSYTWTLVDVPIRSALIRGSVVTTSSFAFTPDVKGTYLVSLRVNNSSFPSDFAQSFCAVVSSGLGWRYKASGESTEDNTSYTGLGFPSDINPRGWATEDDLEREAVESTVSDVSGAIVASPGPGTSPLVRLDSTTGLLSSSLLPTRTDVISLSNSVTSVNQTEVLIGGLYFDPSDFSSPIIKLRLIGEFNTTDTGGSGLLRLYDMGDGVTVGPEDLRSTITIPFAQQGAVVTMDSLLTPTSSPGTNTNTIYNSARIYEVRLYIDTATTGSTLQALMSGLVITHNGT